ncbi:MAG: hypothetical protein DCC49_05385 [Acidobacteria bacterium]|nr:MAG: hypothetical protein DCC49_05385 [Acidobacteriota bacterium]
MRKVGIAVTDSATSLEIAKLIEEHQWIAVKEWSGDDRCDAVICDPELRDPLGDLAPRTVVIAETAEEALRFALRIGAREAIAWPVERRLLPAALDSAASRQVQSDVHRIGVTSARSCGATVFVAHLASALIRSGVDCVAFDCDLAHADLTGLLLDTEPSPALEDALVTGCELPIAEAGDLVIVPATGGTKLSSEAMGALESYVAMGGRCEARIEIFDIPSAWLSAVGDVLPGALGWLDLLIMAVPLDFPGVRRGKRIAEAWGEHSRPALEILLVQRRRHGIAPDSAIEAIGMPHLGTLPLGGEALGEAIDEGRLLSARPGTPYGREIEHLAIRIASKAGMREEAGRKASRIGSLFEFVAAKAASA